MRKIYTLLLLSFISIAQAETNNLSRYWMGVFIKKPLGSSAWSAFGETQLRYSFDGGGMQQTLFRGGVLNTLSEKSEVGLLMGYVDTALQQEYRPTLQYVYKSTLQTVSLTSRNRLEYRSVRGDFDDSYRFRTLFRLDTPLCESVDFSIWDEVFLNLDHERWNGNRTFDRNRFFIGLRHRYPSLFFDWGYLHQWAPRSNGPTISDHVLVTYFYF